MRHAAIRWLAIALLPVFLVPAAGFAGEQEAFRAPPDFRQRIRKIRTIGILKPEMKIFEITSGGVKELRPEWCDEACGLVKSAVTAEFQRIGFELKAIDPGADSWKRSRSSKGISRGSHGSFSRISRSNAGSVW